MIEIRESNKDAEFWSAANDKAEVASSSMGDVSHFETEITYIDGFDKKLISVDVPVGASHISIVIPLEYITELIELVEKEKRR